MVSPSDETNIPGLFAIGDIANGRPELSPPAKLVILKMHVKIY